MAKRRDDWIGALQALAEAFFQVFRTEWELLRRAWWSGTFKRALHAAVYFLVAAFFMALFLVLMVVAAVMIAAIWVEPWKAVLIVAGAVLAVALLLGALGWFLHLRSFKNPIATARERLADHAEWWRERLLESDRALPEGERHGESSGDESPGETRRKPPSS